MTDLAQLQALVLRHIGESQPILPRVRISTFDRPSEPGWLVYDPVVCFVLQGSKQVFIGDQVLDYGAGDCMVVAAELAAMGQISEASPERPYIALNLSIDPDVISALLQEMGGMPAPPLDKGFGYSPAGPALIEAWRRFAELLDHPAEIPVMAHHREHELMFRLLMGPQGPLLRQIAGTSSHLSHVRRSMAWIRKRYTEHLSIEAMAMVAGMSVSVFHRRFKAISGLSPLQYQKQIRLHEARRRLIADRSEAASVAYAVGYESVSQFSREYKRLFGAPPRKDAGKLQNAVNLGP
ncbi:AraC family transcriptional regulator [Rhizobium paranaense]|uniref:AraC-like DNA-binding protein n=1 Tax=Rhizobium paranaense TaxID=1650438 RepID=A0A7W8XY47_9HYPH|nr:AraC family transcriptional regulator [Rhizobium paranaense]MBB5577696.1 AraC-like DNA-binding protein [Rhizobium paranaense]